MDISPAFRLPDLSEMPKLNPVSPETPDISMINNASIQDESIPYQTEVTEGNTELHTACIEFRTERVDELLKEGSSVDRVNIKDRSCLHEMVLSYLSFDMVDQAARYKKLMDILTLLHKAGLDLNMGDLYKQTPLHYVASHPQQDDLIKVLFFSGVRVNAVDKNGDSPLHLAVKKGDPTNVHALLEGGANPNLNDRRGDTALHIVAKGRHHSAVLKHLIKCGGQVDKPNKCMKTALHVAAKAGRIELADILLLKGANPALEDDTGQNPLHLAAAYDMTGRVCLALLREGANPNIVDAIGGETPLHKAVKMRMTHNIDILVRHRAKLNIQDVYGDTPLHKAADLLKEIWAWKNLLLVGRQYVDVLNHGGKSPLKIALEKNNQVAVSLMRLHSLSHSE